MTFTNWELVHKYNRLVRREIAEPIRCPDCQSEYVSRLGPEDEPVLHCILCDRRLIIGQRVYDKMRAVVTQYFSEE